MTIQTLIKRVMDYNPAADADLLRRAYDFSARVHAGQRRRSGEPYLTHPLQVATIITDLKLDAASVATGLLHDTVEDTLATLGEIEQSFGGEIASLVDGVTKISQINFQSHEEKQAENFRKMIIAMAQDIRVLLVKLADRTHNMRTLGHLEGPKQIEIAQETLDIYAPLAHRLGIYWLKNELEDASLRYLHPEVYYQLKRWVAKKKDEREQYIKEVISILSRKLEEAGIDAEVAGRPKHFYSIYEKMQKQNLMYDQVYDLVAFRVLVDSVREAYEVLGIVHANWRPVPGRVKDYIALPKPNFYQSLHTTVIGPYGERMEVQIRTEEMHRVAEHGIAAHWKYKGNGIHPEDAQRFAWLRQLVEWQQSLKDPQEFLQSVKTDLFAEEVYVFSPTGDLFQFAEGATVIDYAYRIHSEVGHHCTGARVNGQVVPLRYRLQNGDTVEIITTTQQTPSKDWLKIVRTSRARDRIRSWIRSQQRARSVVLGRELLERDLKRHRLDLASLRKDGRLAAATESLRAKDEESLLAGVGYGRFTTQQVLARFLPAEEVPRRPARRRLLPPLFAFRKRPPAPGGGVRVNGVDDVLVRFGRCCSPLPGEPISGFITRGRGVTVHSARCPRILDNDPVRRVEVVWEEGSTVQRPVRVEVLCADQPGMLASISKAIGASGINISRADVRPSGDRMATNTFEFIVDHVDDLNRVLRNLGKLKGVYRASRLGP